jgi:uncharacterized protein YkwD
MMGHWGGFRMRRGGAGSAGFEPGHHPQPHHHGGALILCALLGSLLACWWLTLSVSSSPLAPRLLEPLGFLSANSQKPDQSDLAGSGSPAHHLSLLKELNQLRSARGLRSLTFSPALAAAAQAHAEDMLRRNYFDHASPEGDHSDERVRREAPEAIILDVRENIHYLAASPAGQPTVRAREAHEDWMNSPGHRRNLLNNSSTHVGFGIAARRQGSTLEEYTVQVFGAPIGVWEDRLPAPLPTPIQLSTKLERPAEFFLFDETRPSRQYPDLWNPNRRWVGGLPLDRVEKAGRRPLYLPLLLPGRYTLCARLPGEDGWHEIKKLIADQR